MLFMEREKRSKDNVINQRGEEEEGITGILLGETVKPLEHHRFYCFLWQSNPLKFNFLLRAILAEWEGKKLDSEVPFDIHPFLPLGLSVIRVGWGKMGGTLAFSNEGWLNIPEKYTLRRQHRGGCLECFIPLRRKGFSLNDYLSPFENFYIPIWWMTWHLGPCGNVEARKRLLLPVIPTLS